MTGAACPADQKYLLVAEQHQHPVGGCLYYGNLARIRSRLLVFPLHVCPSIGRAAWTTTPALPNCTVAGCQSARLSYAPRSPLAAAFSNTSRRGGRPAHGEQARRRSNWQRALAWPAGTESTDVRLDANPPAPPRPICVAIDRLRRAYRPPCGPPGQRSLSQNDGAAGSSLDDASTVGARGDTGSACAANGTPGCCQKPI
jgi:hypothetical protein